VIQEEHGAILIVLALVKAPTPELLLITQPANANVLQQRRIIIKMQEQAQVRVMNVRKLRRIIIRMKEQAKIRAMNVRKLRRISGLTEVAMYVPKLRQISGLTGIVTNVRRRIRTIVIINLAY
jgi:hypothetical protein